MNQLADSSQVVRGRVAEAGSKRWNGGEGPFVVVETLEFVEGDASEVLPRYRKSFPLFGMAIPSGVHKHPSSDRADPLASLLGLEGKERIFFLRLPTESSSGTVSWGPPPDLRARFGPEVVGLVDFVDEGRIEAVRDARKNLERESAWVKDNARRLVPHDRFLARAKTAAARGPIDDAAIDALSEAASAEVVADLQKALGKPIVRTLGKRAARDASVSHVYDLRVEGEPELDSTLATRHVAASGALASLSVSAPLVKRLSAGQSTAIKSEDVLTRVKSGFDVRFEGGLVAERVAHLSRGDGAQLIEVTFGSPTRIGTSPARSPSLRFALTRPDLALFDYHDDFASLVR